MPTYTENPTVPIQAARLVLDQWVLQRGIYEDTLLDLAEAANGDVLPVVEEARD